MPQSGGTQLTGSFHSALAYASMIHQDQKRKARAGARSVPYVLHLLGTCAIVLENGGSETEAIAALLHDAIEDQGGECQAKRIRELFGEEVERLVRGCTDSFSTPKAPWPQRKREYIERLKHEDESIAFVSAADKLDNARATARDVAAQGEHFWKIFNAPKERTIAYYRRLIEVYRAKGARLQPIVDELAAIIEKVGAGVPLNADLEDPQAAPV